MIREIGPRELAERLQRGDSVHLLDVRQSWEHETAALPDSQLIPLGELGNRVGEVTPSSGALVVVYCHHGVRSRSGAAILMRAGLDNVVSLAGGIDAWSALVDPNTPRY